MEVELSLVAKDRGRVFADGYRGKISDATPLKTNKQAFLYPSLVMSSAKAATVISPFPISPFPIQGESLLLAQQTVMQHAIPWFPGKPEQGFRWNKSYRRYQSSKTLRKYATSLFPRPRFPSLARVALWF